MVAGAVEKNLRLVFEPAKGARVDESVAVALIMRAPFGRNFLVFTTASVAAELCVRRENLAFDLFEFLSGAGHGSNAGLRMSNEELKSVGREQFLHGDATQFKQTADGVFDQIIRAARAGGD